MRKKLLAKNVIYNFLTQAVLFLIRVSTTPFIVHRLGAESYGILSMSLVISGFMSMLDLGISNASIKFISESQMQKEEPQTEKIIQTSLVFYLALGLAGAFFIASFSKFFVAVLFKIPAPLREVSLFAFYITAALFFIKMLAGLFQAVIMALQRFDLYNVAYAGLAFLQATGSVLLLYKGYHLRAVLIWNIILALLQYAVFRRISGRLLPRIKFRFNFDPNIFRKLIAFGGNIAVQNACGKIIASIDKILLGVFMPIRFLPFYVIPYNISLNLQAVVLNFIQVIFPEASGLYALDKRQALAELFFRVGKYLIVILFPASALLAVFAKPLLYFWIGAEFAQKSVIVLQILSVSMLLLASGSLSGTILSAIGKVDVVTKGGVFCLVCDILLCFLLIPLFKINGAAAAFGIAHALLSFWLVRYTYKNILRLSASEFLAKYFRGLIIPCGLFLLFIIMVKAYVDSALITLFFCLLGTTVYIFEVYYHILDAKDRELIRGQLFLLG